MASVWLKGSETPTSVFPSFQQKLSQPYLGFIPLGSFSWKRPRKQFQFPVQKVLSHAISGNSVSAFVVSSLVLLFFSYFLSQLPRRSHLSLSAFSAADPWAYRSPCLFPTSLWAAGLWNAVLVYQSSIASSSLSLKTSAMLPQCLCNFYESFLVCSLSFSCRWTPRPTANALFYYSSFTLSDSNSVLVAVA